MTTKVTVQAHCGPDKRVRVTVENRQREAIDAKPGEVAELVSAPLEERFLQHGETTEVYAYGDRLVCVHEEELPA